MTVVIRRFLSVLCTLSGAALILASLVLIRVNSRAEADAAASVRGVGAETAAVLADAAAFNEAFDVTPDYVFDGEREMPVVNVSGSDVVGQVEISRAGVTLPVGASWSAEAGAIMPCRFSGSAYSDDMIIAGHSYRAHFRCLYDVRAGDEVFFTDADGNVFEYRVREVETVPGDDLERMLAGDWDLTLFTCTANSRARVTLRCERVSDFEF